MWKKYKKTGSIVRKQGSGQTSKLTNEIKILIEEKLKHEDETSLQQFKKVLEEKRHMLHYLRDDFIIVFITSMTNTCRLVVTRCDGWYWR